MANSDLITLLNIYDRKRFDAINDLEFRKQELFSKKPRLEEIEKELNSISIKTVKSLLVKDISAKEELLNDLNKTIENLSKERNSILQSLKIDEAFLEPNYDCKLCKDTGYVSTDNTSNMCICLKQNLLNLAYNKSNLNNLTTENFSTFDLTKYSDKSNMENYGVDISPRENMKNILKEAKAFVKNFDSPKVKNLLFTGTAGLGKTFLSNCIANELICLNKTVLYQTAPNMLDAVVDYRFGRTTNDFYNKLLTVDLLIIDDLGSESLNSIKLTELFNIINSRLLSKNTKTIVSTNIFIKQLANIYSQRIFSRFMGNYNICVFFGDDIRLMRNKN
ncbi:MAG: ATP-binding protein [Oscillospiraceae bacterium]|nr:ATP-binding protein [Oscillospiraceae bacterium]